VNIQPRQYVQRVRVNRATGKFYSSVDSIAPEAKQEPTIIERIKEVFIEVPKAVEVPKYITVTELKPQVFEKVVVKYNKLSFAIGFLWGAITAAVLHFIGW